MAEQWKLILNNWSLGMSADEYSGGSFLYWENVNISRNSKSFKLADRLLNVDINNRWANIIAMVWPYVSDRIASFSTDWRIESQDVYNSTGGTLVWWAAYKRTTWWYLNATKIGNYTIWITADKLDLLTGDLFTWIFDTTDNIILNPTLTTNTNWTVWAWRATWAWWATHTTGTAAMFSDDITVTTGKQYRISVEMTWCTTGSVEVYWFWWPNIILDNTDNGWIATSSVAATGTTIQVAFAPTNTFNWTIKYVSVLEYSWVEEWKATITSHTRHPIFVQWPFVFIWSGSKVDIVDTTDWTIYQTISLLEQDYDIFHIWEIWQSIVVLSTNWENTKVSYWDWVSENATETITYKDKVGTWAEIDGNVIYMICESNTKKELYIISWYDKLLVAKTTPQWRWFDYDNNAYAILSRNNFHNESTYSNAICFSWNKLIIPAYYGLYTYWYENPQQKNALVKERKINTTGITAVANIWGLLYIAYNDVTSGITKISYVREYNNIIGSGYVVTTPIIWDNFSTEKMIDKIKIGYIIPESTSSIDIYVNADKYYFWTFYVSGLTTTPTVWATYSNGSSNVFEVISTNITTWAGTITCRATTLLNSQLVYGGTLTKIAWTWDATITFTDHDNFIKIKTITADKYTHWSETIFAWSFVAAYIPDRHEVEIKIKITSTTVTGSPVIYDMPILSSPTNNDV
jgi:hypothetical protein